MEISKIIKEASFFSLWVIQIFSCLFIIYRTTTIKNANCVCSYINIDLSSEFEQALGVGEQQGSLVCCSPWGHKESDTAELLNNNRRALDCLTKMNNWQDTWNLENSCFCKPFLCCTKKQFFLFMHDWQLFSEVHLFEILDSSRTTLINLEEIHGHLNTQPRWPGPVSHIQGIFTHTEEPLGASPQRLF